MSTEKMGFGVGWILYCVTMTQILSISPLCQHKVASSFGCLKVGVIVRAIAFLFMSLWGEGNVALGVMKRFPKRLWKTLLRSHWPELTRALIHLFIHLFIHVAVI